MRLSAFVRSLATTVLAGLLLAGGTAQTDRSGSESDSRSSGVRFPVVKTQPAVAPVVESSFKHQPQVNSFFKPGRASPTNPKPALSTNIVFEPAATGAVAPVRRIQPLGRFPGIDATGWVPPDPHIAAGPNHVVQVVNSDIAWFDKTTGNLQFQVPMEPIPGDDEGFFESLGVSPFVYDPKVLYDPVTERFIVVALELGNPNVSKVLIAVSDDSDPNGAWAKYRFEAKLDIGGVEHWFDYPGFGCNRDAVVVTGNMFPFVGSGFGGSQAIVIPKAPLVTAQPATASQIHIPGRASIQVARTFDPNVDKVFMVGAGGPTNQLRTYAVVDLAASPVVQELSVPIPAFQPPASNAPSAQGRELDTLDGRILDAAWRGGRLYACHAVRAGVGDVRTAVRWYEFETNGFTVGDPPTLRQAGTLVSPIAGEHYNMPGLAVNQNFDLVLVFTRSSESIVADIMAAGRRGGDPLGTVGTPIRLHSAAGAAYGGGGFNRWGDYFGAQTDPVDGTTFWTVGMTGKANGNWTTFIDRLTVVDLGLGVDAEIVPGSVAIFANQGTGLSGGVAELAASDASVLSLTSVAVPRLGQVAALDIVADVGTGDDLMRLSVEADMSLVNGAAVFVYMQDFTTGELVLVGQRTASGSSMTHDFAVQENRNRFRQTGTHQVRIVIRVVDPIRTGRRIGLQLPFVLLVDRVTVKIRS
ncbi:MAG: hypothetical protein SNJ74_10380 [Fimbriimonadaceae bacterium]